MSIKTFLFWHVWDSSGNLLSLIQSNYLIKYSQECAGDKSKNVMLKVHSHFLQGLFFFFCKIWNKIVDQLSLKVFIFTVIQNAMRSLQGVLQRTYKTEALLRKFYLSEIDYNVHQGQQWATPLYQTERT